MVSNECMDSQCNRDTVTHPGRAAKPFQVPTLLATDATNHPGRNVQAFAAQQGLLLERLKGGRDQLTSQISAVLLPGHFAQHLPVHPIFVRSLPLSNLLFGQHFHTTWLVTGPSLGRANLLAACTGSRSHRHVLRTEP
jgi:hypothetical protein